MTHPTTTPGLDLKDLYGRYNGLEAELDSRKWQVLPVPEQVVFPGDDRDFGVPITAWLRDLNLLEDRNEQRTWIRTPFDKQAITAGTTALVKFFAPAVGLTGLAASVTTYVSAFSSSGPGDWVLLACATALLCVTAIVVGWLVSADVSARSRATAAQYQARAAAAGALTTLGKPDW